MEKKRLFVVFVFVCLSVSAEPQPQWQSPQPSFLKILQAAAERVSVVNANRFGVAVPKYSLSALIEKIPPNLLEDLKLSNSDELERRLVSVIGASNEQVLSALEFAESHFNSHQDDVLAFLSCLMDKTVGGSCSVSSFAKALLHGFMSEHDSMTRAGESGRGSARAAGFGTRPVGYLYSPSPGVQSDLGRGLFWLVAAVVFTIKPIIDNIKFNIAEWLLIRAGVMTKTIRDYIASKQLFQGKSAEIAKSREKWRIVMSVFPTYEQFERAYKHSPDHDEQLQDLCLIDGDQFVGGMEQTTDLSMVESCWEKRRTEILQDARGDAPTVMIGSIPLIPEFLIATAAFVILVYQVVPKLTTCSSEFPPNNSWQCTNSNMDESVCILTCASGPDTVAKIARGNTNVRVCRRGSWFPETFAACGSHEVASYSYGVTRLTT